MYSTDDRNTWLHGIRHRADHAYKKKREVWCGRGAAVHPHHQAHLTPLHIPSLAATHRGAGRTARGPSQGAPRAAGA